MIENIAFLVLFDIGPKTFSHLQIRYHIIRTFGIDFSCRICFLPEFMATEKNARIGEIESFDSRKSRLWL